METENETLERIANTIDPDGTFLDECKEVVEARFPELKEKCKNCGKTKEEHIDNIWCHDSTGSCGSQDWSKFQKEGTNGRK